MSESKESGGRLRAISALLASLVIPVVVVVASSEYTSAVSEREMQTRYVELAVGILSSEPDEFSVGIRKWATDIVNTYSTVRIPAQAKDELLYRRIQDPVEPSVGVGAPVQMTPQDMLQFREQKNNRTKALRSQVLKPSPK
jgi:hypothetical protein